MAEETRGERATEVGEEERGEEEEGGVRGEEGEEKDPSSNLGFWAGEVVVSPPSFSFSPLSSSLLRR